MRRDVARCQDGGDMDQKRTVENRAWMLASIQRLMAPGIRLPPKSTEWLVQQRDKFYADPSAVPGSGLRDRMRRTLAEAGLERRRPMPRRMAERGLHAPDEPRAPAPSSLQGSRKPTPMPPWLISGQGLPLRPPRRRPVSP